jgi:hypothetical protein
MISGTFAATGTTQRRLSVTAVAFQSGGFHQARNTHSSSRQSQE